MQNTLRSNVAIPGQTIDKKKVKALISATMEAKFLVSSPFRSRCERFLRAITGDYSNLLKFQPGMVCTDGKIVWVDPTSGSLIALDELTHKIIHVRGQITHEAAHILYTNFGVFKRQLLPPANNATAEDKFRWHTRKNMLNIVEDEAIEMAVCNEFPGAAPYINLLNDSAFDHLPSLDEAESKQSRLQVYQLACCMYGIIGKVKGTLSDPELIEALELSKPILEAGRYAVDTDDRLKYSDQLYEIAKKFMEEAIQNGDHEQNQNGQQKSPNPKGDDMKQDGKGKGKRMPGNPQDFRKGQKSSGQQKSSKSQQSSSKSQKGQEGQEGQDGDNQDSTGDAGDQDDSKQQSKSKKQKEQSSQKQSSEDIEPDLDDTDSTSSKSKKQDDQDGEDQDQDQGEDQDQDVEQDQDQNEQDGEDGEEDQDSDDESNEEQEGDDGDPSNELSELEKELQQEIQDIFDEMKNEEENQQKSQEREHRLREEMDNVKYSKYHDGFSVKTITPSHNDPAVIQSRYQKHAEGVKPYARSLSRRLINLLRFNQDDQSKGMAWGHVDAANLFRDDHKIFTVRKDKSEQADLCVMVLVDESGSMSHRAYCERDQTHKTRTDFAREACIMLAEVCQQLNIPLAVWGHNVQGGSKQVQVRKYIDFGQKISEHKSSLSLMDNDSNTREGVSLKYAGEYLARQPQKDKLLIVISDGDPEHSCGNQSLGGKPARIDASLVVEELEKKRQVSIIGVSIGDGHQSIPEIYKNYICIPSLDQLPGKICKIIEKRMFKDQM